MPYSDNMRRAIIHIGHPKTATTFLQHVILLNRDALADAGYYVPSNFTGQAYPNFEAVARSGAIMGGNAAPFFYELQKGGSLNKFITLLSNHGERDLLLSSELLFYYPHFVEKLAGFLSTNGFFSDIIAYVGRHDIMTVKAYCQNICNHGYHGTLSDFLMQSSHPWCRYHQVRERLLSISGVQTVEFRTFTPALLVNHRIEDDFFSFVSPTIIPEAMLRPHGTVNSTPSLPELEAVRYLNRIGNTAAIRKILARPRNVDATERERIRSYYFSEQARQYIVKHLSEDKDAFVARLPAEQHSFWCFDTMETKQAELDTREVAEILDFSLA